MKLEEILQQHQLQQCHAGNQELERTWEQVLGGCSEGQSTWIEELENKKISTEFPLAHKTDMPHSIYRSPISWLRIMISQVLETFSLQVSLTSKVWNRLYHSSSDCIYYN